jgi:hypothetical protein
MELEHMRSLSEAVRHPVAPDEPLSRVVDIETRFMGSPVRWLAFSGSPNAPFRASHRDVYACLIRHIEGLGQFLLYCMFT